MWGGDKASVIALAWEVISSGGAPKSRKCSERERRSRLRGAASGVCENKPALPARPNWEGADGVPPSAGAAGGGGALAALPLLDPGVGANHQPALPQRPV